MADATTQIDIPMGVLRIPGVLNVTLRIGILPTTESEVPQALLPQFAELVRETNEILRQEADRIGTDLCHRFGTAIREYQRDNSIREHEQTHRSPTHNLNWGIDHRPGMSRGLQLSQAEYEQRMQEQAEHSFPTPPPNPTDTMAQLLQTRGLINPEEALQALREEYPPVSVNRVVEEQTVDSSSHNAGVESPMAHAPVTELRSE